MSRVSADREPFSGSPLQGVLLALLLDEQQTQPLHGYKLATLVKRRLGPAWGVTRQSVYGALGTLEDDKLVSSVWKKPPDQPGPGRRQRVYSAAAPAETVLAAWMESPLSLQPVRVELQARIAVSRAQDAPRLLRALDGYERDCFAMLRETNEAKVPMGSWAGLALNLQRMGVDESLQAELRWIATARRWIMDFLGETSSETHR
jgi:DNA-binding PadR family transcriptional regulator